MQSAQIPSNGQAMHAWANVTAVSVGMLSLAIAARVHSPDACYRLVRAWSGRVLRMLDIDVEIEDRNEGRYDAPCVFVGLNQSSLLEVALCHHVAPVPMCGAMNIEFALVPFLGWATWASGFEPIVRQWPAQARRGLDRVERRLAAGRSVAISIEGRRSVDGRLQPFKKGPVILALRTGVPLVPVIFHDVAARLPYGEWRVRPGTVRVTFCEAIPTSGRSLDERDALIAELRSIAERELSSHGS